MKNLDVFFFEAHKQSQNFLETKEKNPENTTYVICNTLEKVSNTKHVTTPGHIKKIGHPKQHQYKHGTNTNANTFSNASTRANFKRNCDIN